MAAKAVLGKLVNKAMASNITIQLLYFAKLGEDLGRTEEQITVAEGTRLQELTDSICARGDTWNALREPSIQRAVNQTISRDNPILKHNDEVAYFPPVTGG